VEQEKDFHQSPGLYSQERWTGAKHHLSIAYVPIWD
jgi:hypothetical protein